MIRQTSVMLELLEFQISNHLCEIGLMKAKNIMIINWTNINGQSNIEIQ